MFIPHAVTSITISLIRPVWIACFIHGPVNNLLGAKTRRVQHQRLNIILEGMAQLHWLIGNSVIISFPLRDNTEMMYWRRLNCRWKIKGVLFYLNVSVGYNWVHGLLRVAGGESSPQSGNRSPVFHDFSTTHCTQQRTQCGTEEREEVRDRCYKEYEWLSSFVVCKKSRNSGLCYPMCHVAYVISWCSMIIDSLSDR